MQLGESPLQWRPNVLARKLRVRRLVQRGFDVQLATVNPSGELGDATNRVRLLFCELRPGMGSVPWDDSAADHFYQTRRRFRPIERVGVVEVGDSSPFDQVAREHHVGIGYRDDDVVVGVTAPEKAKVDCAVTDIDPCGLREDPVGRIDHHVREIGRDGRFVPGDPRPTCLAGPLQEGRAALMSPDRRRSEHVIPEGVIEVAMRVHDDRDRIVGDHPEVVEDLATLDVGRSRIDDQDLALAQNGTDVLIVELVPPDKYPVADLNPAGHEPMVSSAAGAYPPAMASLVDRATTADGVDLLVRRWKPPGDPWASVLLVHGLGEHSGRYEHVGDQLAAAGLQVAAYDARGNGGSAGRRGHVDRWAQYHDDLAERLREVRAAATGGPVVLYGHSMGGLVVLGYLLSDRPKPDLVVVTAPGLDSTLAGWKKLLAPILGRLIPTLPVSNGIDGRTLSRDPTVAERVRSDPASTKASTARFGAEAISEQARVRRGLRGLSLPILALHGTDDGLVPPASSEPLAELPNVDRRTYPGLRHELHNEPEGPQVLADVVAWLRARATIPEQPNNASGERLER